MQAIVTMDELVKQLHADKLVIVDCRLVPDAPDGGRAAYEQDHIPGAVYLDFEQDMCGRVQKHGGRHPLPDLGTFSLVLGELGIGRDTMVVAYDDQDGAVAARLWWMLTFLGHERAHVLEGGYSAWKAAGHPVSDKPPAKEPRPFLPRVNTDMMIATHDLQAKLGTPDVVLMDAREPSRYRGETEPVDAKAGHIPSAVNHYWRDALDEHGFFRPAEAQRERFSDMNPADEVIVYSGSGLTACVNVLTLKIAAFPKVRLYLGGWSDWISHEGNPVATGDE